MIRPELPLSVRTARSQRRPASIRARGERTNDMAHLVPVETQHFFEFPVARVARFVVDKLDDRDRCAGASTRRTTGGCDGDAGHLAFLAVDEFLAIPLIE